MHNFSKFKRSTIIFILGLLSAIGPFSIDMYLPAFKNYSNGF
ncbi:bicyclomycin/multidrug efflux system [Sphingobacterium spiritivorum]|uniref:Bicyclomycin/multidrug efflux system n=1 Tax=Sphingobacterium spiritivorum TaxID=258 RepID=A0A380BIH0_SPHSI|nr:bicyclomycin/multidrug efflux system [Sphingobacterium spiritivorum]